MAATTESELLHLVSLIYEAATDASVWPAFLKAYAEAVDSEVSVIQVHHFKEHQSELLATFGVGQKFRDSYNDHYSRLNVWREEGQRKYLKGRALLCHEVYPQPLLAKTEFYNDYLRPLGGVYCAVAVIDRNADTATTLTAQRPEGCAIPGEPEIRLAELLLPHLTRANGIRKRLSVLEAGRTVLDRAPFAVVFLDAERKCLYANNAAESIFLENDGLTISSGTLRATRLQANAALQRAIRQALSQVQSIDFREAVVVERTSMRLPYQVIVAPSSQNFAGTAGTPAAIVIITAFERREPVEKTILSQMYGLTSKEAELANKVCEGKRLDEVARELSIRYETARTHLRRIFSKTGVSRQAELVLLLGRIPRS